MYFYSFPGIHAVVESAEVSVSPFDITSGIVQSHFCRLTVSHSVTLHLCSLFLQETRINCIRIARKGELFNADATELFFFSSSTVRFVLFFLVFCFFVTAR